MRVAAARLARARKAGNKAHSDIKGMGLESITRPAAAAPEAAHAESDLVVRVPPSMAKNASLDRGDSAHKQRSKLHRAGRAAGFVVAELCGWSSAVSALSERRF